MYQTDFDEFKKTIGDLCVSVNRPFNDDLARVFWEDLKGQHLSEIRERAKYLRACGKSRFTANDLKPERPAAQPVNTFRPLPPITWQQTSGNLALFRFLLMKQSVPDDVVGQLVATKNKIVATAADDDDPIELRDVLLAAFERIAA